MYTKQELLQAAFNFYYDMSHKLGVPENLITENFVNVEEWFKDNDPRK